ncbi:CHAT domain-containing protein [Mesorhizobium sp. ORM16]|uniref:CHAT domain-containing protein n=1 Tax=Mesorhizobium sp. ORM16 TaxID=3376989 RepID=UPI00385785CF
MDHPTSATVLDNLAILYRDAGRPEAEEMFKDAAAIRRRILGPDHPHVGLSLQREAEYALGAGRPAEAGVLFGEAAKIAAKTLGENHAQYAIALHGQGVAATATGRPRDAIPLLAQAIEAMRRSVGQEHDNVGLGLVSLSVAYLLSGQLDIAIDTIRKATSVLDRVISRVFRAGSERVRAGFLDKISDDFHLALALISRYRADVPNEVRFAYELLLRRKSLLSETLSVQRDALLGTRYPTLAPLLQGLLDLRRQLAIESLAGPGSLDPADHENRLARLFARRERAEADLSRQIPELWLEERLRNAGIDDVAAAVDAGTALVEFIRIRPRLRGPSTDGWAIGRYLAFVLPGQNPNGLRLLDLGPAEAVDTLIDEFLRSVRTEVSVGGETVADSGTRHVRPTPDDLQQREFDAGDRLSQAIFEPLRSALDGMTRLIVAPDGDLSRIPFEALPNLDGDRLIDTYCFSYVVCGRDCVGGGDALDAATAAVVIADPDFNLAGHNATALSAAEDGLAGTLRKASLAFTPLPETLEEGRLVGEMLGVAPLTRDQATTAAVRKAKSPRVIHFATHGFFLPDQLPGARTEFLLPDTPGQENYFLPETGLLNPLLRSGLALAGANTFLGGGELPQDAGNGLLTAEDIVGLNLTHTDMAVLSACDTGIGVIRSGEGVYGLRRAFAVAGVRTLVLSLWPVGDAAARHLMTQFYNRIINEKEPRAQALRNSMLALKAQDSRPWYWAAFICQGNPGPLLGASDAPPTY